MNQCEMEQWGHSRTLQGKMDQNHTGNVSLSMCVILWQLCTWREQTEFWPCVVMCCSRKSHECNNPLGAWHSKCCLCICYETKYQHKKVNHVWIPVASYLQNHLAMLDPDSGESRDGHHNCIQLQPYTLQSMYGHSLSPYKPISCRPASPVGMVMVIHTAIIQFIMGMGSYELSYNLLQMY